MSEKTELLNFIYKNANMGETAMPMVIGMVTRPDLRAVLSSCLMDYRAVGGAAKETMRRCGHRGEDPGAMKKSHDENGFALERAAFSAAAAHCRNDDPRQHHGCYQMSKRINAYRYTAGEEALMLAERLLKVEEETVERMKAFCEGEKNQNENRKNCVMGMKSNRT